MYMATRCVSINTAIVIACFTLFYMISRSPDLMGVKKGKKSGEYSTACYSSALPLQGCS